MPAFTNPDCRTGGAGSICGGLASNIFLVSSNNVTIGNLTAEGDNPALTGGVDVGGANIDARNGIITNHPLGAVNNLVVTHTCVQNIYLRGIYASSSGTFDINNNQIQNVQADAGGQSIAIMTGTAWAASPPTRSRRPAPRSSPTGRRDDRAGQHHLGVPGGIHTDNAGGSGGGVNDVIEQNNVTCRPTAGASGRSIHTRSRR